MHNTKTYVVINIADLNLVDFVQVSESSASTIRKSVDETQFTLKWEEGYIPTFITDGTITPVGTYDHHAILELMATPAWTPEEE
jgi:hypothetical protein